MKKRILAILLASALAVTPVSYVFAEEGTTQNVQTQETQTQETQTQEVQAQTQEVPVEQGGVTGGYPVSYTHLDVYKRQDHEEPETDVSDSSD